jgi:hypothetical protein
MNRLMRLYFYGILGAIGGLIAWQSSSMLGLSFTSNLYLSEVFAGALIGLCIGLCIGFAEGVLTRNPVQFLKASLVSGALGLIGGAIALPVAEGFFQILGGEIWGRLLGWGLFGLLIGLATGITGGAQMWKGGLGGILGGLLGGGLLEAARKFLSDPLMGKPRSHPDGRSRRRIYCPHRVRSFKSLAGSNQRQTQRNGIHPG